LSFPATSTLVPNDSEAALLTWLKTCGNSAWHEIEEKWIATSKIRLSTLMRPDEKGDELLVADYFELYPFLRKPLGYTLVSEFRNFLPDKC